MKEFYNGLRFGITTKSPILVRSFLDNKYTDYCVLYGDDSEPGCETCFVTLNPLDEEQIEYIKNNSSDFTPLRTPSEFSNYVLANTYGHLAEAIQQNFPPEKVSEIAKLIKTDLPEELSDEFGRFF